MADKFTFYESMADAFSELPGNERLAMYDAMCMYAFSGAEPEFESLACKVSWKLIKPLIDKSAESQETGRKGGRPRKTPPVLTGVSEGLKPPFKPPFKPDSDSEGEVKTLAGFNPLPAAGGTGATKAAPPASETTEVINEVEAKYAEWEAEAVPCPEHLRNPMGAS